MWQSMRLKGKMLFKYIDQDYICAKQEPYIILLANFREMQFL